MEMKKSQKVARNFVCEKCDYASSKETDMQKHFSTRKHNGTKLELAGNEKVAKNFRCNLCNKNYKTASGVWKHKKTCHVSPAEILTAYNIILLEENNEHNENNGNNGKIIELLIKENSEFKNIVLEMVKSNNELQKQMIDVCKNSNITNINQNNSHNKTFNLHFFLNEQCKDAMNISDFVNTFELQLEDLESVSELGYVEGITKIIVDKLNSMDIYKRPMHCSDAKREILYIKDDNKWEKEQRSNPKLRKAIKSVSFKNMKIAVLWSDTYPESKNGESRLNDTYMKLIKQSTGGNGEIGDSEDKIIRRIAKEILIDKL